MEPFLIGAAVGAFLALAIAVPLLASWPTRLRWLLAAPAMDPFLGLTTWSGFVMREVTIVDVRARGGVVEVGFSGGAGAQGRRSLVTASCAPGLVAQLDGWCATNLPLLLVIDASGDAQLSGPEATATGFREVIERV